MTANGAGEDRNAQGHRQNQQHEQRAEGNGGAAQQPIEVAANGSAPPPEQPGQNGLSANPPQESPAPEPQTRE